jgi:hypothetical protein
VESTIRDADERCRVRRSKDLRGGDVGWVRRGGRDVMYCTSLRTFSAGW